jgi:hypothetical protein
MNEKRRKLTAEERVWRYNYQQRVFAGVIPLRNSFDRMNFQRNIWWYSYDVEEGEIIHDCIFNYDTGLYELRERKAVTVVEGNDKYYRNEPIYNVPSDYEKYKKVLEEKPMPEPPSEKALPPTVKATQKEKTKFISKCPEYLKPYIDKLIKD